MGSFNSKPCARGHTRLRNIRRGIRLWLRDTLRRRYSRGTTRLKHVWARLTSLGRKNVCIHLKRQREDDANKTVRSEGRRVEYRESWACLKRNTLSVSRVVESKTHSRCVRRKLYMSTSKDAVLTTSRGPNGNIVRITYT